MFKLRNLLQNNIFLLIISFALCLFYGITNETTKFIMFKWAFHLVKTKKNVMKIFLDFVVALRKFGFLFFKFKSRFYLALSKLISIFLTISINDDFKWLLCMGIFCHCT